MAGQELDMTSLPPIDQGSLSKLSLPSPATVLSPYMSGISSPSIEQIEVNQEDASKIFNAPESASSVLEALQQRLEKFKTTQIQATAEQNASKARRLGRIVKQYETAIKDHKSGKPVPYEELPCPPGLIFVYILFIEFFLIIF